VLDACPTSAAIHQHATLGIDTYDRACSMTLLDCGAVISSHKQLYFQTLSVLAGDFAICWIFA
jgi:hypothetical protein